MTKFIPQHDLSETCQRGTATCVTSQRADFQTFQRNWDKPKKFRSESRLSVVRRSDTPKAYRWGKCVKMWILQDKVVFNDVGTLCQREKWSSINQWSPRQSPPPLQQSHKVGAENSLLYAPSAGRHAPHGTVSECCFICTELKSEARALLSCAARQTMGGGESSFWPFSHFIPVKTGPDIVVLSAN